MKQISLCVCLAAIMVACRDEGVPPEPPVPPIVSGPPQWAMFHHDSRHTGNVHTPLYDGVGPAGDSVRIRWQTSLDYGVVSSAAVASDGTVYVGTQQNGGGNGSLYAINPDGSVKWQFSQTGRIWSSPALGDDGSIYVGGLNGFYGLTPGGSLKWKYPESGLVISSPAIGDDGTVYYVSDALKAIDPQNGTLKWQVDGGDHFSSPSIGSNGTIFYCSHGELLAVSPQGQVKWRYKDSSSATVTIRAQVIDHDGTVYFSSAQTSFLYAVDTLGRLEEKFPLGGPLAPCIDVDGYIYMAPNTVPNRIVCLASDGQVQWEQQVGAGSEFLETDLLVDKNGIVYVGVSDYDRHLSLAAVRKHSLVWQFFDNSSGYGGSMDASPVVFGGTLFFAWRYGTPQLYALQ